MAGKSAEPRKEMPDPQLPAAELKRRFLAQFADAAFVPLAAELERVAEAAWGGISVHRKSPRTRRAGSGFADPACWEQAGFGHR
jgi:hypothetical protein